MSGLDVFEADLGGLTPAAEATGFLDNVAAGYRSTKAYGLTTSEYFYQRDMYKGVFDALGSRGRKVTGTRGLPETYDSAATAADADLTEDNSSVLREVWRNVAEERRRDPSFLADLPNRAALEAAIKRRRLADLSEAADVTDRATTFGQVGALAGALGAGFLDPVNYVGLGGLTRAGSALRTILLSGARGAGINAGASLATEPVLFRDAEKLGLERGAVDAVRDAGLAALFGFGLDAGTAAAGIGGRALIERWRARPDLSPIEADALQAAEYELEVRESAPYAADAEAADGTPAVAAHVGQLSAAMRALELGEPAPPAPSPVAPLKAPLPANVDRYSPDDLETDAARLQYKAGGDDAGVTDRLAGVAEWNPILSGKAVVWETADGKRFVADGHQRLGLAKRLKAKDPSADIAIDAVTLREADGWTAEKVRTIAALKNIAEGSGSAVDAAKVLRGPGADQLQLPPRSALVRDARALGALSDEAFGAVVNEVIPADYAALIGRLVADPELHASIVEVLAKTEPATRLQAESIVRQAFAAGATRETQTSLFGTAELTQSLYSERARVIDAASRALKGDRRVFRTLVDGAARIEQEGNTLARDRNARKVQDNAEALAILVKLANSRGPVSDALSDAARIVAGGGTVRAGRDAFLGALDGFDIAELARGVERDGGDRLGAGRDGRGGGDREADGGLAEQVAERSAESRLDDFDEPRGPAFAEQTAAAEHDMLAALPAAPEIGADPANPVFPGTGRSLEEALAEAKALIEQYPPPDASGRPGTHNVGSSTDAGDGSGRTRGELRAAIVDTLLAAPARQSSEAHIVLGPPGAGKSTVAGPMAAARGARIIDSDDAKAMLPEFRDGIGASAVHIESTDLAGYAETASIAAGDNILLPLVGKTYVNLENRISELVKQNYSVYVYLVGLPIELAVPRVTARYAATGRVIFPDYVRSIGDAPRANFERLVAEYGNTLKGYLHVSNDVPEGQAPRLERASDPELYRLVGDGGLGLRAAPENPRREPGADDGRVSEADLPGLAELLEIGEAVDPAAAARLRQELQLRADAPLRPRADQAGDASLGFNDSDMFAVAAEVDADGKVRAASRPAAELIAELDADQAAIDAVRACLE